MSNSLGQHSGTGLNGNSSTPFFIGRVKSVVTSPYINNSKVPNPDYLTPSDLGKITFEKLYSSLPNTQYQKEQNPAWPMFSFVKQFPIVGEIVALFYGPSENLNVDKSAQKLFYMPAYAMWNAVNHNAMPNLAELAAFYGKVNTRGTYQGSANSIPEFPKGYTFTEKDNIRSLTHFEGDSIIEGRYGQSIRFGSTVPGFKGFNDWSDSGNNGDPIIIFRNGQGAVTDPSNKFAPTVEDINTDMSSIYMTSGQRIVIDDLSNFPMNSYGKSIADTSVSNVSMVFEPPMSQDYISAKDQDASIFNNT